MFDLMRVVRSSWGVLCMINLWLMFYLENLGGDSMMLSVYGVIMLTSMALMWGYPALVEYHRRQQVQWGNPVLQDIYLSPGLTNDAQIVAAMLMAMLFLLLVLRLTVLSPW